MLRLRLRLREPVTFDGVAAAVAVGWQSGGTALAVQVALFSVHCSLFT